MKKVLKKKIKESSKAVRYFSTETLTAPMTTIDTSCWRVLVASSCACS